MLGIPRAPLFLGLTGLLPFAFGALIATFPEADHAKAGTPALVSQDGAKLLLLYGTIILSFMSGVLWGFATKAHEGKATHFYALSVLPALWTLFMRGGTYADGLTFLIVGFCGLLLLDYVFHREGLTPPWWMRLRILLTSIVVICLSIGVFA